MTLKKIAKLANVSISTVSKAFSDSKEISAETKEMIIKVAKETGCYEKYHKPKYEKKLIAVICPEVLGIQYSQMITYMEREISELGGTMILSVTGFSAKIQNELMEYYTKFARVDGIIIIEPVEKIKGSTDIPIIQIGHESDSPNVHCIQMDISKGLDDAIKKLVSYGHSKIGFVGEIHTPMEYELFKQYMEKNKVGLNSDYILINNQRFYDCGYYGMDEFINKGKLPTAIVAAYSHIAVGILQRLNEEHINVPEDISLICMDDINSLPYSNLKLSCIKMHLDELCSEAIHLLYSILENNYSSTKHLITVQRQFFEGESINKLK